MSLWCRWLSTWHRNPVKISTPCSIYIFGHLYMPWRGIRKTWLVLSVCHFTELLSQLDWRRTHFPLSRVDRRCLSSFHRIFTACIQALNRCTFFVPACINGYAEIRFGKLLRAALHTEIRGESEVSYCIVSSLVQEPPDVTWPSPSDQLENFEVST